jgi:hypothetical protein
VKYGYNPDQPRDERGRWTDTLTANDADGSSLDSSTGSAVAPKLTLSDETPDAIVPSAQYAQTRIEISPSAITGKSRIDEATRALTERLAATVDIFSIGSGATYGRIIHESLKMQLRFGAVPGIAAGDVEPTYGGSGRYGSKDSIRPDVVLR